MNSLAVRSSFGGITSSAPRKGQATNGGGSGDDHERFKSVVLPHLSDAYTLARWLTGSPTDSEDVVQDACLRAFRGIANFCHGNARAWLLTIVRHTAYSWLHKNRPAAIVLVEDIQNVVGTQLGGRDVESPEMTQIAQQDAMRLQAAIAALPTPFREILVLRDIQGLAYREIAEVTGLSIGTVMSRLSRARDRLFAIIRTMSYDGFATATRSIQDRHGHQNDRKRVQRDSSATRFGTSV
jgi:RNA polymerase sigma factor (sigma-70 family)